ncbi:MAG TPA: hypothetical protein VL335_01615 [Candidatus Paceibacterota bacterium]|jgi:hypothetical protein|nr:hypothetical protein [Candidatus Paceibacterota bacterium]
MKRAFSVIIYIFAIIGFLLVTVYGAVELGLTKTSGIIDRQHDYFKNATSTLDAWQNEEEWNVLKEAILKDVPTINRAAAVVGIPPRFIVSTLIVEQLRLFHSDREIFKSVFAPLKILGTQSQFSWGVMGIKQDTAIQIENNLTDTASPWYIGNVSAHTLDYPATTTDKDAERFARLTDEHDRYYSYLYGACALKELISQWDKAGVDISDRPEILATLFNIGFQNSHPHQNPESGGAAITLGSTTYSFGDLAGRFYYSNELINEFPRQ